ncbi:MAG: hypothetical protein Q9208_000622 [Pyrenodesmia sp. 3 TL-2023]
MPHSPLQKTVHAPINNLEYYKDELARHRCGINDGERDKDREEELLDIGQDLFDQCEFLEDKLYSKKQKCNALANENTVLQQNVTGLQSEVETLKGEIASLKDQLDKAPAASAGKELDGTIGTGEESEASADTAGQPESRKRKR